VCVFGIITLQALYNAVTVEFLRVVVGLVWSGWSGWLEGG